jgi:hypothetical protein
MIEYIIKFNDLMGLIYEVSYNNYGEVTHCEKVSYAKETETSFVKEAAREATRQTETANQEASEER